MTVRDLLHQTRDTLQDTDGDYWSDSELLDYYNGGIKAMASERLEEPKTTVLNLLTGTYEYNVDGVLRYISAKDSNGTVRSLHPDDTSGDEESNGIIVLDYDRIYVNTPVTNVAVSIKHIAIPANQNLNDTVRSGDENTLKYFMMSKAYEKETDMENFQKSQYFDQKYMQGVKTVKKTSALGYVEQTEVIQGYYY
jgi:hypothetical protein